MDDVQPGGEDANVAAQVESDLRRARKLETVVSWVLRIGVLTSFALVVAGTIMTFTQAPSPDIHGADAVNANGTILTHVPSMANLTRDLALFSGPAWIALGLIILILTPVMRVAVSVVGFAFQRDVVYVGITLAVLTVLIMSFFMGRYGG